MEVDNKKNDQNIIPNDADKPQKGVNVPNLRFGQFHNIWTKKSLHNITKKINIKNKNRECKNVICNSAQLGLIRQIDFFDKEIAQDYSIKNYTIIKKDDFVYNPRKSLNAPYGPVNIYNYDETGVVSPLYLCFRVNDIDKIFLHYYFKSQAWYRFIYLNGDSGARHDRVSIKDDVFFSQNLYIPNAIEQQKIATFLSLIDKRIDTQSKIIEDLELFKKGIWNYIYLIKSNDWECVKLSNVLCERKDFALKGDEFIHATLSKDGIFAKTNRYDRDFLVTNNEKQYKITRLNDICYNPANLKFEVICLNKFGDAIFSPIYVTYTVKNDFIPSFVELILTSSRFLKYIRKYEQGTVYERMAVNSEDFLKGEILIPTKDKQKAIADYFDILDLKIKKEKDILELYKKQKAYLLKNMFI